jgi:hypothetical protein
MCAWLGAYAGQGRAGNTGFGKMQFFDVKRPDPFGFVSRRNAQKTCESGEYTSENVLFFLIPLYNCKYLFIMIYGRNCGFWGVVTHARKSSD